MRIRNKRFFLFARHAQRGIKRPASLPFQRGQALVEFLYVSLAMVPVFLLLPMIGKYQDVAHATQMASRYAALDSIVHHNGTVTGQKGADSLANEIRHRFFGQSRDLIQATDGQVVQPPSNPAWQTPFGRPLIAAPNDVSVNTVSGLGASDRDIFNQQGTTGAGLANRMQLPAGGLYRANVAVQLANLPDQLSLIEPFNDLNLNINRHTVILHETWSANHPSTVEQRTATLVPVAQDLRSIESTLNTLVQGVDMGRSGPQFNRLEMWRDMVPSDRIRP